MNDLIAGDEYRLKRPMMTVTADWVTDAMFDQAVATACKRIHCDRDQLQHIGRLEWRCGTATLTVDAPRFADPPAPDLYSSNRLLWVEATQLASESLAEAFERQS